MTTDYILKWNKQHKNKILNVSFHSSAAQRGSCWPSPSWKPGSIALRFTRSLDGAVDKWTHKWEKHSAKHKALKKNNNKTLRNFPGGPVVKTLCPRARVWVQSLVKKLRFHMGSAWPKTNKQKNISNKTLTVVYTFKQRCFLLLGWTPTGVQSPALPIVGCLILHCLCLNSALMLRSHCHAWTTRMWLCAHKHSFMDSEDYISYDFHGS